MVAAVGGGCVISAWIVVAIVIGIVAIPITTRRLASWKAPTLPPAPYLPPEVAAALEELDREFPAALALLKPMPSSRDMRLADIWVSAAQMEFLDAPALPPDVREIDRVREIVTLKSGAWMTLAAYEEREKRYRPRPPAHPLAPRPRHASGHGME